jgi:hypothetical protein
MNHLVLRSNGPRTARHPLAQNRMDELLLVPHLLHEFFVERLDLLSQQLEPILIGISTLPPINEISNSHIRCPSRISLYGVIFLFKI